MYANPWRFTAGDDLAFSATFETRPTVAVPEPGGVLSLAAAGAAGVWVSRRRVPGASAGTPLRHEGRARSRASRQVSARARLAGSQSEEGGSGIQ